MLHLNLKRNESSDQGTFGTIVVGEKMFVTGELPWRNNEPFNSCIPRGIYECRWTFSRRFSGYTYEVMHVPGREGIRFHVANLCGDRKMGFRSQVDGCIAIGKVMGDIRGQRAVLASADAVIAFETVLAKQSFTLDVSF